MIDILEMKNFRMHINSSFVVVFYFLGLLLSDFVIEDLDKLPLICVGLYGWLLLVIKGKLPKDRSALLFALFCAYLMLGPVLYQNNVMMLKYMVLFFLLFGLFLYFFYVYRSKYSYQMFMRSFVLMMGLISLIGVADYLLYEFGYITSIRDYHITNKADSFFNNPNPFGILASLTIPIILENQLFRLKCRIFMLIVLLAGVVVSGSTMALLIPMLYFSIRFLGMKLTIFFFFASFLTAFIFLDIDLVSFFNKRIEIWSKGFLMWKESPIFGIGTGNFQVLNEEFNSDTTINSNYGLHSMYAWLLIETGLVGSFLFSCVAVIYIRKAFRVSRSLGIVLILILISQLTEFFLDHEEIFSLLFISILAKISSMQENKYEIQKAPNS